VRLIFRTRPLRKGQQLGFSFKPKFVGETRETDVRPHARKTKAGMTLVAQHKRKVPKKAPEPVREAPPVAEVPEPVEEPSAAPEAPQGPQPPYFYDLPADAAYVPEHWSEATDVPAAPGRTVYVTDIESHPGDLYAIGARKLDADGRPDMDGKHRARRSLFSILKTNWAGFLDGVAKMNRRAKKLGLEEATVEVLQEETTRRVPVGVKRDGDGRFLDFTYGNVPAKLVRLIAPKVKVEGWTFTAKIEKLDGGKNVVARIDDHAHIPQSAWTTDMVCEHCGVKRDRNAVFMLTEDATGGKKLVGSSCMKDFLGQSALQAARAAEWLAGLDTGNLDVDVDGMMREVKAGRSPYIKTREALALAYQTIEEDGGYKARGHAILEGVGTLGAVEDKGFGRDAGAWISEAMKNERIQGKVDAFLAWIGGLTEEERESDDWLANAHSFSTADTLHRRQLKFLIPQISKFERYEAYKAEQARPRLNEYFGKTGDKLYGGATADALEAIRGGMSAAKAAREFPGSVGASTLRALAKAGDKAHNLGRLRVKASIALPDYGFGESTLYKLEDSEGRTFTWKTGTGAQHGNTDELREAFSIPKGTWPEDLFAMSPGDVVEVTGGSIKGHRVYTPRDEKYGGPVKETQLTRVQARRVITDDERERFHSVKEARLAELQGAADAYPRLVAWGKEARQRLASNPDLLEQYDPFGARMLREHGPDSPAAQQRINEALVDAAMDDPDISAEVVAWQRPHRRRRAYDSWQDDGTERLQDVLTGGSRDTQRLIDPEYIEDDAQEHALGKLEAYVHGQRNKGTPLVDMRKGKPERMRRVKFRPDDGEDDVDGHIHTQGQKGATIIGPKGNRHQVEHGRYRHHEGESVSKKHLLAQAEKHLELGPRSTIGVHAVGVMLAAGGIDHVSKLTTKDVRVGKGAVYFLKHKLKLREPKRLAAMVAHLASQGDGPLLRVDGKPVDHDSLMHYAKQFGKEPEEMRKASPLAMDLARPSQMVQRAQWMHKGYTCTLNKGPSGISVLAVEHPSLPLPLVEVAGSLRKAKVLAANFIAALLDGKLPERGVFARID
jgi:hypothetical protein